MYSLFECIACSNRLVNELLKRKTKIPEFTLNELTNRPEACNFIEKETLAQMFSCEFREISKNTFSYRTTSVAASAQEFRKCLN